jgi:DNA-binding MarR family transcriptional regulator
MCRAVDDLERLGAAVRLPDPGDRRVRLVGLTSTGRDLLDQAQTLASDAAEDLFSVLSDDQASAQAAALPDDWAHRSPRNPGTD